MGLFDNDDDENENKRPRLTDPRALYTPSDQQYPSFPFRPDYVDPSFEKPVQRGLATGGAENTISPLDFPTETASLAAGGGKLAAEGMFGAGRMLGNQLDRVLPSKFANEIGSVGKDISPLITRYKGMVNNELPSEMSLLDRIKLAKERSGPIRQTETFEQAANSQDMEKYKNMPKNFFDRARQNASQKIYDQNEASIQDMLNKNADNPERFEQLKRILRGEEP